MVDVYHIEYLNLYPTPLPEPKNILPNLPKFAFLKY
jgi:hypothetical protein